ncbi:hypothetical protein PHYSODRAFT_505297, partial [Phytophthora sojae]
YLRTDRHYHRFQFRRAIVEAVLLENAKDAQRVVKWLWRKFHGCIVPAPAVHMTAGQGGLGILKFFKKNEIAPRRDGGRAMRDEVDADQGHVVRWGLNLFDTSNLHASEKKRLSLDTVARRGDIALVKYLHEISVVRSASTSRQTKRARISRESRLACTTDAMDQAASSSHLDVVKWLHANRSEGCTTRAMDFAAGNGHLQVVKWLSAHRSEGCTVKAMDVAASRGHLDVVKWLHRNQSEGCTTAAMDSAATGGHLKVVAWLHINRTEGCTTKALDGAAENGHLSVVKWLHKRTNARCTTRAMDCAASEGHLEVVKWLHQNRVGRCTTAAMDGAARNGNLDVVKWLHKNRSEGCTTAAMDEAKTLEIVQWLQANRVEGCIPKAMDQAASDGDFDRVLFLHSESVQGCTGEAFFHTHKTPLFMGMRECVFDSSRQHSRLAH